MGARPLARKIDELIRVPLSKKILFERVKNATVNVQLVDGEITFEVIQKLTAKVNPDGFVAIDHDAGTLLRVAMAAIENGIKNNPTASDICCVSEGYALLEDLHEVITGGRFDHINRYK